MQRPENRPHIIRAAFLFLLVSESQQQAPQVHYNRSWPGVERNGKQMRVQNCGQFVSNLDGRCVRFTRQVALAKRHRQPAFVIAPSRLHGIESKNKIPSIHRLYALALIYGKTLKEVVSLYGIPL